MNEDNARDEDYVNDLSLADCYEYDSQPDVAGEWLRFYCPVHKGDNQKSFCLNKDTGGFYCHNCEAHGRIVESRSRSMNRIMPAPGWGQPAGWADQRPLVVAKPMEADEAAVKIALNAIKNYEGSEAQEYARGRGVSDELAKRLSLGYCTRRFRKGDSGSAYLTAPLYCPASGVAVGVYARNLWTDERDRKVRIKGPKGLFGAFGEGPLPEDVVLVEGPFDAIALLNTPGLPLARAVVGVGGRAEWFDACRRVTVMFDDDGTGQKSLVKLRKRLSERRQQLGYGPKVYVVRPQELQQKYGCKDLGEMMQRGIPIKLNLPPLLN